MSPTAGERPPPAAVGSAVVAGLEALFALLSGLTAASAGAAGQLPFVAVAVLLIALSGVTVYGAVAAVRGRSSRVLLAAAVALSALWLVVLVVSLAAGRGVDYVGAVLLVLAVGMGVGVRRPAVRAWTGD